MRKVIYSMLVSLDGFIEGPNRLVRDNIAEEVTRLKAQPGKAMDLGGPHLAATFMQLGLIDEYRLFVQPVILGSGTPFFPALDNPIKLRLVETRTFGSGVVYLRYQCAGAGQ